MHGATQNMGRREHTRTALRHGVEGSKATGRVGVCESTMGASAEEHTGWRLGRRDGRTWSCGRLYSASATGEAGEVSMPLTACVSAKAHDSWYPRAAHSRSICTAEAPLAGRSARAAGCSRREGDGRGRRRGSARCCLQQVPARGGRTRLRRIGRSGHSVWKLRASSAENGSSHCSRVEPTCRVPGVLRGS